MSDYIKDIEPYIQRFIRQVVKAQDAAFTNLLREAYEAGFERGGDEEAYSARGAGPYTHAPPDFEEWLAAKLAEVSE